MLSDCFAIWHYDLVSACLRGTGGWGKGGCLKFVLLKFLFPRLVGSALLWNRKKGVGVKGRKEILHTENEASLRINFSFCL
jgi:hypothetical protein